MERREFQLKYKGNRCVSCGESVAESFRRYGTFHRLFHFNHIDPSKKDSEYDNVIRQNVSTKQLDEPKETAREFARLAYPHDFEDRAKQQKKRESVHEVCQGTR